MDNIETIENSDTMRLITLNELKDLRNKIGFHFTPKGNASVIAKNGLQPLTGDLASGTLGKEAIDKVFFSYGLEGVLQIYNNLLYLGSQNYTVKDLQTNTTGPFLPSNKKLSDHLSLIDIFELVRQYMENNQYFIFDVTESQYDRNLTGSEISKINENLKELKLPESNQTIFSMIKQLDKELFFEASKPTDMQDKQLLEEKKRKRNELSLEIRKLSKIWVDEIRGSMRNSEKNPLFDRCDYDDGKMMWYTLVPDKNDENALPHNAHTRILETENGLQSVGIPSEQLGLFSLDGKTPANGIDFLREMYSRTNDTDILTICHRPLLLDLFLEYVSLVEQYKSIPGLMERIPETPYNVAGVSSTIPPRLVMDLDNIEKYPELSTFVESLETRFRERREKRQRDKNRIDDSQSQDNKITPAEAVKSALKVTSADKSREADNIEMSELNLANTKKGVTKDD